ncbi:DUF6457 domain-containing protein [Corynebacterium alimapuense]|uniref:DUF6457 domain-containing protein n=1 Tax=Corynebacterium alimapuense TaxID=1576874 RepID=A0A3M8K6Q6_9CORY|nr:DUF6457 domain-containing protein [Corynebacterium alimapuense]RNE48891.1 hypothetical protein C5L39_06240 [Corynebacterium alimapuense]
MSAHKHDELESTHEWLATVALDLDVDPALLRPLVGDLLKLTKEVAHNGPSRPAAPLTAFLVGLSAGAATTNLDSTNEAMITRVRERIAQIGPLLDASAENLPDESNRRRN